MKRTTTLINVSAGLLVVSGILMRVYNLLDEQVSLTVSLFGVLLYVLAAPEQSPVYRRNLQQKKS